MKKSLVDLWHWKDDYVQPIQKVRAEQERNKSYRAVYHIKEKKFVQLADETMENISPSNDGRYAIGTDNRQFRTMADHDPGYTDYYLVNTLTGARKLIAPKQRFGVSLSPNAKYAIYFDGKDWNSYSVADGKVVNLTRNLGARNSSTKITTRRPYPVLMDPPAGPKTTPTSCSTIDTTSGRLRRTAAARRT